MVHPAAALRTLCLVTVTAGCFSDGGGRTTEATSAGVTTGATTGATPTGGLTGDTGGVTTSSVTEGGEATTTGASTQPMTGSGDPSATGEIPAECDAEPLCTGAVSCAACSLGTGCDQALAVCQGAEGDQCNAYLDCALKCKNESKCLNNCYESFPGGYEPAWKVYDCSVCSACPQACVSASAYCANGGGGPGTSGTCDDLGDCMMCGSCSVFKECATEVKNCVEEPQCQPYQECNSACKAGDTPCNEACKTEYPEGYRRYWAQFDCGVCDACPGTCSDWAVYCQKGGGGPNGGTPGTKCLGDEECAGQFSGAYPFCVDEVCSECTSDGNCGDPNAPSCVANFCR